MSSAKNDDITPRGLPAKNRGGDHTRAHESLKREVMLAISELNRRGIIHADFASLSQFAGYDIDGAHRRGGMCAGAFDLIGCVENISLLGVRCDLEIKTGRGKLSDAQMRWQARVRRVGGAAECVRNVPEAILAVVRTAGWPDDIARRFVDGSCTVAKTTWPQIEIEMTTAEKKRVTRKNKEKSK